MEFVSVTAFLSPSEKASETSWEGSGLEAQAAPPWRLAGFRNPARGQIPEPSRAPTACHFSSVGGGDASVGNTLPRHPVDKSQRARPWEP